MRYENQTGYEKQEATERLEEELYYDKEELENWFGEQTLDLGEFTQRFDALIDRVGALIGVDDMDELGAGLIPAVQIWINSELRWMDQNADPRGLLGIEEIEEEWAIEVSRRVEDD
jgi:hypothetical protein